jgi:biotin synthase
MTSTANVQALSVDHSVRHDWQPTEVKQIFEQPLNDLLFTAHSIHRQHFDANAVQLSTLLNIKTGGCSEDCSYCSQSARHDTAVPAEPILDTEAVLTAARKAKAAGATRFCMGAAWRSPRDEDLDAVLMLIDAVKDLGMETCVTLGMLQRDQAQRLSDAGLDYYNHNLDTSPEFYGNIVSTHTYQDRLDTLRYVRDAGMNVCCGGIVGMGETNADRAELLRTLANLPQHPESVPINLLVKVPGTPLSDAPETESFDVIRTVATARILMPRSYVRLSAGRTDMTDEAQALCFFAGANSIFYGEQLLTTPNPLADQDRILFDKLGLSAAAGGA